MVGFAACSVGGLVCSRNRAAWDDLAERSGGQSCRAPVPRASVDAFAGANIVNRKPPGRRFG
jgi:hypothetical protein